MDLMNMKVTVTDVEEEDTFTFDNITRIFDRFEELEHNMVLRIGFRKDDAEIASFYVEGDFSCCGMCALHYVVLGRAFDDNEQGYKDVAKVALWLLEEYGFGGVYHTTTSHHHKKTKVLESMGFTLVKEFVNPRTDHEILVHFCEL